LIGRGWLHVLGLPLVLAASASHADIRPLLREQGFNGPLNGRETISYAGQVRQGANAYRIYTYHGVFRAAVVDHGVNRIIVILNNSIFLGEYPIPLPTRCKVRGQKLVCNAGFIDFTKRGPPSDILFDGEPTQFQLGEKITGGRGRFDNE
jgi:hypothetical protein